MTITFLAPDGVAVTAQQERQAKAAQHGGGSGRPLGGRSGFRVGTSDTVLTATSTTWTLAPCAAMLDPGASTHQGMYGWSSDANITGAVTASDATNPRKDIVYIQVNDSSAGDGSGELTANVKYLAGVADGTNVAPDLPARSFLVATLSVPPGTGTTPTVVRNPAVYVAAGAPLPIASQAAEDALVKYRGFEILRTDLPGMQRRISDGSKFMPGAEAQGIVARNKNTGPDAGSLSAIIVLQNIASFKFLAGRKYRIGFEANWYVSNIDTVILFRIGTASTSDAAGATTGITVLNQTNYQAASINRGFPANFSAYYEPSTDATLQVKVTGERIAGTGTFAMQRATFTPNVFYIEDLGAQF